MMGKLSELTLRVFASQEFINQKQTQMLIEEIDRLKVEVKSLKAIIRKPASTWQTNKKHI